jgi:hypothetical protein
MNVTKEWYWKRGWIEDEGWEDLFLYLCWVGYHVDILLFLGGCNMRLNEYQDLSCVLYQNTMGKVLD